jgi:hypothetical protein
MRRAFLPAIALVACPSGAFADAMADKLCPILAEIAGSTQGYLPEAVQAQVVIDVGSAYDFDHDALMQVLDGADALGRLPRRPRRDPRRHRQTDPRRRHALTARPGLPAARPAR